jgi:hypothetical protein
MAELTGAPGFAPPKPAKALWGHHGFAVELIATVALTLSLVVAATAVSLANRSLSRSSVVERPAAQVPVARE